MEKQEKEKHKVVSYCFLGTMDYAEALTIQEKLLEKRRVGTIGDVFLLVEHPPVLTLGRRGNSENILMQKDILEKMGVKIYEVSRGGDVTYHGPGQLVGYPIMDLNSFGKDIKDFVWKIEEIFIRILKDYFGVTAERDEKKYTGVWVGNEKVTAIGIAVKHWITMHGFAFNINTDLSHFNWINPCGITDKGVTSLQKITGRKQDYNEVMQWVLQNFAAIFDVKLEEIKLEDLKILLGV